MKHEWTVEQDIATYRMRVRGIPDDYNWETDVLEALIGRSKIAEIWDQLTAGQQAEVRRTDDALLQQHERVAEMLPSPAPHDRSHWWWFLHEGPQVREEAQAA